jgi:hypothetical protein
VPAIPKFITRRQFLQSLLALAVTGFVFFSARGAYRFIRYRNGADELAEPWMSIGYVARAHNISPADLHDAIGLPPGKPDKRPLGEIRKRFNMPLDEFMIKVNDAIAKLQTPAPKP